MGEVVARARGESLAWTEKPKVSVVPSLTPNYLLINQLACCSPPHSPLSLTLLGMRIGLTCKLY